ncbi:hypothetical protein BD626DRAFT_177687 [Schizophyllum amplum]|uniref:Uncharacterized protein n=1 Tax=Schizophyllum amplum TaxID=97359 RepID=A0A550C2A2_9AGAR|nr:hypothetical protein BD626DRAFT_177687 [Auriculariopsis ampla]
MATFEWRCTKPGCPDPDYPKNYDAASCMASRGPATCKAMRHGYKYHYKQVTMRWGGGTRVIKRNEATGLFECPCGDPTHARRHSQRLVALCRRHPSPGEAAAYRDTSDEEGVTGEDDGQPGVDGMLVSSAPYARGSDDHGDGASVIKSRAPSPVDAGITRRAGAKAYVGARRAVNGERANSPIFISSSSPAPFATMPRSPSSVTQEIIERSVSSVSRPANASAGPSTPTPKARDSPPAHADGKRKRSSKVLCEEHDSEEEALVEELVKLREQRKRKLRRMIAEYKADGEDD